MPQDEPHSPDSKDHEPTQKKLDDARRQGDVAKSTELMTAAAYAGLYLGALATGGLLLQSAQSGAVLLDQSPEIAKLTAESARAMIGGILTNALVPFALIFAGPGLLVILSLVAQQAFGVSTERVKPRLSRISPWETAKKKFGPDGLFDFAKSFAKLCLVSVVVGWMFMANGEGILSTAGLDPRQGLLRLIALVGQFLMIVTFLTLAIGAVDLAWQRHALRQRHRMSRQELLEEMKDSEGDPQTKMLRRQRGQELAMNQLLVEVPKANVIIVNPTHYAVAIAWTRGGKSAPIVVAKGVDEAARTIRRLADEHAVPIHSDPPTARALFASIPVGKPVTRDHYRAVAAAIRFAEAMRRKAKTGSG